MSKRRSKYRVGNFKLHVKRAKTGKGLFTEDAISKGACVIEYTGRVVSEAEQARMSGRYLFEVSKKVTIDGNIPSNPARYINHSCAPNCEADGPAGRVFILALRNINPGEELTYDYGKEYFDEHIKPNGCRCTTCANKRAH
jgi:hypothetical protein